MEEVEQSTNPAADHLLDWLNDSVSILPSVQLDEPAYAYQWWDPPDLEQVEDRLIINPESAVDATTNCDPSASEIVDPGGAGSGGHSDNPVSKKRKPTPRSANRSQRRRNPQGDDDCLEEEERVVCVNRRTTQNGKRPPGAKNGGGGGWNGREDARWAEQLLKPCAEAIAAGNASRVQHYLCVLQEVASVSGDANYRLAAHGLRALTRHLSGTAAAAAFPAAAFPAPPVFAATEPKLFHDSLIRFNELSPWFSFPNAMANASILHALSSEPYKDRGSLRIIDIGVSHGVQWPTLLEALTRRPGGPPSLVRLTVVPPPPTSSEEEEEGSPAVPFSVGPPGDDFPSRLLRFAKRIDLNLQIDEGSPAPEELLPRNDDETLVVCAQFRLHQLTRGGGGGDEKGEFLRGWRAVGPDLVVVSEDEGECGGGAGEDYGARFARRAESLWRFLDSTSAAFKGRECAERRVVEGEAARLLAVVGAGEAKEGRAGWCARMRTAGFVAVDFGEDAVDGGRALLRKYDGSWEMRMDGAGGVVSLCWKGHPVSFCSLWKVPPPGSASSAATPP